MPLKQLGIAIVSTPTPSSGSSNELANCTNLAPADFDHQDVTECVQQSRSVYPLSPSHDKSNASTMNLTKLGGVGGVTRSGSWLRTASADSASRSSSGDSDAESDGDDELSSTERNTRDRMQDHLRKATDATPRRNRRRRRIASSNSLSRHGKGKCSGCSGCSRTSTSASTESTDTSFSRSSTSASSWTSSSSAAAFSLRSVANTMQTSPVAGETDPVGVGNGDRALQLSQAGEGSLSEVSGTEAETGSLCQSDATSVADGRTSESSETRLQLPADPSSRRSIFTLSEASSDTLPHMQSSTELIRPSGEEVGPSAAGVRMISQVNVHSGEDYPNGAKDSMSVSAIPSTDDSTSVVQAAFLSGSASPSRTFGRQASPRRSSQSNAGERQPLPGVWTRAPPPQTLSLAAFSLTSANSHAWTQPLSSAEFEPAQPRRHLASALGRTRSAFSSRYPDITSAFSFAGDGRVAARSRAAKATDAISMETSSAPAITRASLPIIVNGSLGREEIRCPSSLVGEGLRTTMSQIESMTPTTSAALIMPPSSPSDSDVQTARPDGAFVLNALEPSLVREQATYAASPRSLSVADPRTSGATSIGVSEARDWPSEISPQTRSSAVLPLVSSSPPPLGSIELEGHGPPSRPPLSRSLTTGLSGRLLRTPTTSEWTNWLVQQSHQPQSRLTSPSASSDGRRRVASGTPVIPVTPAATVPSDKSIDLPPALHARASSGPQLPDQRADLDADVEVMERLRVLSAAAAAARSKGTLGSGSQASSSLLGSDLESVGEDDEDTASLSDSSGDDDGADLSARVYGRRGSSSSLERMQALHEAISRPASRLGSPILSPYSSPTRPLSPSISLGMSPIGVAMLGATELAGNPSLSNSSPPASPSSSHRDADDVPAVGHSFNLLAPEGSMLQREATVRPGGSAGSTSSKMRTNLTNPITDEAERDRQATAQAYNYPLPPSGMSRTINDFVITGDIGKGAYGLVKKIRLKGPGGIPIGDEWAVKFIIKGRILADCWRRHRVLGPIPIEIHVMDQLRRLPYTAPAKPPPWSPSVLSGENTQSPQRPGHPNICPMLDFFEDRDFYYLVMPFLGKGQDLFDYIESAPNGLSGLQARGILGQIADALSFLHANAIVHRDLKDENVVLHYDEETTDTGGIVVPRAQLIDFGSATHVRRGRLFDTFSGTLDYAAAEILRGEKYAGQEQDVWALGVVGYVLVCGECPFWNGEEAVIGLAMGSRALIALRDRCFPAGGASADDTLAESLQPDGGGRMEDAADLIMCCLDVDPTVRPTAQQVCQHRFLIGSSGWTGRRGWDYPEGS